MLRRVARQSKQFQALAMGGKRVNATRFQHDELAAGFSQENSGAAITSTCDVLLAVLSYSQTGKQDIWPVSLLAWPVPRGT